MITTITKDVFKTNCNLDVKPLLKECKGVDIPSKVCYLFTGVEFKKKGVSFLKSLKQKGFYLLFDASNCDFVRQVIESGVCHLVFNCEIHSRKNYTYQTDSGLDLVICALMKEKEIIYGVSYLTFKQLMNSKSYFFVKFKQNLSLCKKKNVSLVLLENEGSFSFISEFFKIFFEVRH